MSRQQPVKNRAQLIDVCRRGDGLGENLFGSRVLRRHPTMIRHRGGGGVGRCARLEQLGQTEVEQLHDPIARDENVRRLEVAVDDETVVRRLDGGGHLRKQSETFANAELSRVAVLVDRLAIDELHDEKRNAVGRDAAVE
ncbi:MAG TPA: hypothetical protein VFL30_11835 [Rhodanobacteraceae bacterium]|nr:hypothetical protein [Rhodanobacteraceae bacterium]